MPMGSSLKSSPPTLAWASGEVANGCSPGVQRAHVELDGALDPRHVGQVGQRPEQPGVVGRVEPDAGVDHTVEDEQLGTWELATKSAKEDSVLRAASMASRARPPTAADEQDDGEEEGELDPRVARNRYQA